MADLEALPNNLEAFPQDLEQQGTVIWQQVAIKSIGLALLSIRL